MLGGPPVIAGAFSFLGALVVGLLAIILNTLTGAKVRCYAISSIGILLSVVPVYFVSAIFWGARARHELGKANVGTYNLRLLGAELKRYAEKHDGYLPDRRYWCDELLRENPKLCEYNFKHPQAHRANLQGDCHFAFNKNLSGKRLDDVPGNVVLLFEADGDWNLSGTEELLKTRYKEKGYIGMFFADQTTADYWFYMNALRKFESSGKQMYYEQPRWAP